MKADKYRFTGEKVNLEDLPCDSKEDDVVKEEIVAKFHENQKEIERLQDVLSADRREGIVIVLQALDAAGKDSLIRRGTSGMNPQYIHVTSFKRPTEEELEHDYLWRIARALPRRGEIAVFNRSYYEDIITAAVHDLKDTYRMAPRIVNEDEDEFINDRIDQVRGFEKYLYQNSFRVVKIFLHVSKDEQRERFLERIDREDKNWKFEQQDLRERRYFDEYMKTFNKVIEKTATKESPWYALPADDKWYTRYLFSEILLDVLQQIHAEYPELPGEEQEQLSACKKELLSEKGTPEELIEKENEIPVSSENAEDIEEEKKKEKKSKKKKKNKKKHKKDREKFLSSEGEEENDLIPETEPMPEYERITSEEDE